MNIVGLDLSLTATGIATKDGPEVLTTKLKGCERLAWVRDQVLQRCLGMWSGGGVADLVVLEGYAYARANQAHQVGELGGVIRVGFHEAQVAFVEVAPSALKKYATGHGNAGKGEVLAAAIRRLGYEGHDDNEADALWLREMGLDWYGAGTNVPVAHREALLKVEWPTLGGL